MKITNILKAALAAVVLVSSTAMPAAAHGPVSHGEMYYDYIYNWGTGQYDKIWVGEVRYYCDGHVRTFGSQYGSVEEYYNVC